MKISVLTLFPEMISQALNYSITGRALKKKLLELKAVNLRDFGLGNYKQVDDKPYGGGVGMILRIDVINKALQSLRHCEEPADSAGTKQSHRIILLDPKGKKYNQATARRLSKYDHLILICGHYEGVDARVDSLADETISIGNYILTGGEIPALVLIDSITRLLPDVLSPEATANESFSNPSSLEAPQYTRPEEFHGLKVPEVLLSGNPKKIKEWREKLI